MSRSSDPDTWIWGSRDPQEKYKELLQEVADASIMLEEYARGQIGQEEQHALEIKKMLKDFAWKQLEQQYK